MEMNEEPVNAARGLDSLKGDHRRLTGLLLDYFAARSGTQRGQLLPAICQAMRLHWAADTTVFIPMLVDATGDKHLLADAAREYAAVMALIDEIAFADPETIHPVIDPVYALARILERHITAAEGPLGLFDRARASPMDCESAGESMKLRRSELLSRSRWQ